VTRSGLSRALSAALFVLTVASVSGAVLVLRYAAAVVAGDGSPSSADAATATFRPIPLLNLLVAATLAASTALILGSGTWRGLTRRTRQEIGALLPLAALLWAVGIASSHERHLMVLWTATGWAILALVAWRTRDAIARS
jgi:hypothetical protein